MNMELLDEILIKHLKLMTQDDILPESKPLSEMGLDSMSAVNLLLELEEKFQIQFPDSMLNSETFASAISLRSAISFLLNGRGS